jgi:hypothetical protein
MEGMEQELRSLLSLESMRQGLGICKELFIVLRTHKKLCNNKLIQFDFNQIIFLNHIT